MGRVIGILLDHGMFLRVPKRRTGHENIGYYNKAAMTHHISPFFMSLNELKLKIGKAGGYLFDHGKYRFATRSIPPVIHNRSMPFSKAGRARLNQLKKYSFVYNGQTRYSKYFIHRKLAKNEAIRPHLPETSKFSRTSLEKMMARFAEIYVKPVSGSIGKGIIKLSKGNQGWKVQSSGRMKEKKQAKVYDTLRSKIGNRSYLIQEGISLAKYARKPFDLRVSVQKNGHGEWQVTGIVGKVAAKGSHVTNVARGGKVKRYEELFSACGWNVEQVKEEVIRVSLLIARQLGKDLSHLADIGLDIGLTTKGKPYFIEMNGRDLRYSFQNAKLYKTWYRTYENPLRYGKYVYEKNC